VDDSKPIFARPSEKALRIRSSGVAEVGVVDIGRIGELIERTAGREFIQQRDENDDFPTVACDLR
jgi:hypothetical protein